MLSEIKKKCGIAESIIAFDDEIRDLIGSAIADLVASGADKDVILSENKQVLNAITCYVKAYRGNDRSDTEKYIKMYENLRLYISLLTKEEVDILDQIYWEKV